MSWNKSSNFFPFKKSPKTECGLDSRIYGSSHLYNFLLGFWECEEHISIHGQKQQASLTVVWQVRHVAVQEPASTEETAHVFVANIFLMYDLW